MIRSSSCFGPGGIPLLYQVCHLRHGSPCGVGSLGAITDPQGRPGRPCPGSSLGSRWQHTLPSTFQGGRGPGLLAPTRRHSHPFRRLSWGKCGLEEAVLGPRGTQGPAGQLQEESKAPLPAQSQGLGEAPSVGLRSWCSMHSVGRRPRETAFFSSMTLVPQ